MVNVNPCMLRSQLWRPCLEIHQMAFVSLRSEGIGEVHSDSFHATDFQCAYHD